MLHGSYGVERTPFNHVFPLSLGVGGGQSKAPSREQPHIRSRGLNYDRSPSLASMLVAVAFAVLCLQVRTSLFGLHTVLMKHSELVYRAHFAR